MEFSIESHICGRRENRMKLIKRQVPHLEEDVITLEYIEWTKDLEEICNYIDGKERRITGYGENKEIYRIKLDEILYFEAVGELVFAYTMLRVYEIKMRLYQAEEIAKRNMILRVSKSFLVNLKMIENVRPALNGRFIATMINGEEVLISRQYAKEVAKAIHRA